MNPTTLHTGGAIGGDKYWEEYALKHSHNIIEYHFDGNKHTRISANFHLDNHLIELTEKENKQCTEDIKKIEFYMGEKVENSYLKHQFIKDWILVNKSGANSLYVVANMDISSDTQYSIKGGTMWIIYMFIENWYRHNHSTSFPIYLKNINDEQFYKMSHNQKWEKIDQIPNPSGNWIGIGSRSLV